MTLPDPATAAVSALAVMAVAGIVAVVAGGIAVADWWRMRCN